MQKNALRILLTLFLGLSLAPFLPAQSTAIEIANLREDVRLLTQRVGDLQLQVEQLQRQNQELQGKSQAAQQSYATVSQLNEAVASLNRELKSQVASSKEETIQLVSARIEKLAKDTNNAVHSLARGVNASHASPVAAPTFSDDYKKEGITYTVVKGDSIGSIAKKTGGTVRDIINANKLSDPSKIQAGQTLFIPGGK
jgi:LysM repeat protein